MEIVQPHENQPMISSLLMETKSVVCDKVSSTLTKTEMDAQIMQLLKIFFDKSVAEMFVQSCLHV